MAAAAGEVNVPLKICYHGTDQPHAISILREGFRKGTYFARHLESAIAQGGPHVFGVVFDEAKFSHSRPHWQFILREAVSADRIAIYNVYQVYPMLRDDALVEEVLQSNLAMGQDYCDLDN